MGWFFEADEIVRFSACKDGWVLVLWYVHKPYVKEHHHLAVPLVVTNCLCRMMGDLERDGFCKADQILYKPFHPGDTSSTSETVTGMASFGLLLFLSLETHWARLCCWFTWGPADCLVWMNQLARMLVLHLGTLDTCQTFSLNPSFEGIISWFLTCFLWYSLGIMMLNSVNYCWLCTY